VWKWRERVSGVECEGERRDEDETGDENRRKRFVSTEIFANAGIGVLLQASTVLIIVVVS
jgi:hypothetical protein